MCTAGSWWLGVPCASEPVGRDLGPAGQREADGGRPLLRAHPKPSGETASPRAQGAVVCWASCYPPGTRTTQLQTDHIDHEWGRAPPPPRRGTAEMTPQAEFSSKKSNTHMQDWAPSRWAGRAQGFRRGRACLTSPFQLQRRCLPWPCRSTLCTTMVCTSHLRKPLKEEVKRAHMRK